MTGFGTAAKPQTQVRYILMMSKEESQSSYKECLPKFTDSKKVKLPLQKIVS